MTAKVNTALGIYNARGITSPPSTSSKSDASSVRSSRRSSFSQMTSGSPLDGLNQNNASGVNFTKLNEGLGAERLKIAKREAGMDAVDAAVRILNRLGQSIKDAVGH